MFAKTKMSCAVRTALVLMLPVVASTTYAADAIEEIVVVGITPGAAASQALTKVPYAVQSALAADLDNARTLDLSDYLNSRLASVSINSAQNNPLQADVQYRGFTASPLLGLPQGLAVYQNGVRINEPLGDAVNWDLVPESAVYQMDLIGGSNPVFGLNTLGGALALTMKNGFNFTGNQAEVTGGSWGRKTATIESGNNNGTWGYYVNYSHFDEDGWRDLSESEARNFYGALSWRDGDRSALDLSVQKADSDLIGNGALPIGMLAVDRAAVFTAPDITANDVEMFDFSGSHRFNDTLAFSGNVFNRENDTDSFNGDGSEFELCRFAGGAQALFEEADDVEDALEDELDIELHAICEGEDEDIRDFDDLEALIEAAAEAAGLDEDDFEIENVTDELSGTGVLSDEAINNISRRVQESSGFGGQFVFTEDLFGLGNQFIGGYSWFRGKSTFESVLELAELDPVTRSTQGLGTGTFVDEAETDIRTETETRSIYFSDTIDLSSQLALTLSGRYNDTDVTLRDRSGERPELNGDHNFARFNPAVGLSWNPDSEMTVYGSYSESNRVPTPIELACNEGVFELAQQYAIAEGEDPDDVEFECRLPNAFLADPPLEDVVTRSFEFGTRMVVGDMRYTFGLFSARNEDDIIFQTTGRSTGLFANVDETQRWGIEAGLNGSAGPLEWYASYSHLKATFEDGFEVLSPNHPNANAEGELNVQSGDRIPGIPENIVKLGGDYRFMESALVGAELVYNSDQFMRGDESNQLGEIGGYMLVNLRASYVFAERFTAFARVTNVFDKDYENFGVLGEDPTEILPGLADDRPYFVGAGAPRAAWLGVKLRF
jgi:outer membrane receptor protein involved in Fe transport